VTEPRTHPLVGARLRGPFARGGHVEWKVLRVVNEDNGCGVMGEFAYLERLDGGAMASMPPGSVRRYAVRALDNYTVVGRP